MAKAKTQSTQHSVKVRLTSDEKRAFLVAAALDGERPGVWHKAVLLQHIKQVLDEKAPQLSAELPVVPRRKSRTT